MQSKRPLEDLKESLLKPEKTELDLTVLLIKRLKSILKENPYLKQIPPVQRGEFCKHMTLHVKLTSEIFITEQVYKPDLYILIDGKVYMKNKAREEFVFEPYDIFGFTKIFNDQSYIPGKVTARETSTIVSIPRRTVKKLMKEVHRFQDDVRLTEFLIRTVPGMKQLGQAGKERILTLFQRVSFKAGEVVIKEGEMCEAAFIVEEGECKLICSKNPNNKGAPIYQGLVSKTVSCYNIGIATVGEWVGDDSIVLNYPIEFSVVAVSLVKALRISKSDFTESLSKETQSAIKEAVISKVKWRKERKRTISHVVMKKIATFHKSDIIDIEGSAKVYPIASKSTIKLMKRRERAKADRARTNQSSPAPEKITNHKDSSYSSRPKSSFSMINSSALEIPYYMISSRVGQGNANNKIQLYSASTLGSSMIPIAPTKRIETTRKTHEKKAVQNSVRVNKTSLYGEKIRSGRPSSPNPAQIWMKKNSLNGKIKF